MLYYSYIILELLASLDVLFTFYSKTIPLASNELLKFDVGHIKVLFSSFYELERNYL